MSFKKRLFTGAEGGISGTDHFAQQDYSGSGANRTINTGFRPAFIHTDDRNTAEHPMLTSSTMHTANASFYFTTTSAQYYNSTTFTGFASNGYTLGTDNAAHYNYSGRSYTSFAWKGNGTSSLVTNTDGNVTSYVDANQEGGFSTVKAQNTASQSVGHGLNQAPEFFIQKFKNTGNFYAWHHSMGEYYQNLHTSSGSNIHAGTNQISSTATTMRFPGSSWNLQTVWYAWHSVEGYSKVSYYTGNGSTQSVNLGFEPRFVWLIPNGQHNIYFTSLHKDSNGFSKWIYPNLTDTMYSGTHVGNGIKLTSTGFDIGNSSLVNGLNTSYYYLAFA
jgi:hypothetical protein